MRDYTKIIGNQNPNYKSGCCVRGIKKPSYYTSWCCMRQRCKNPHNSKYQRYGGRGIKICEEWNDIKTFKEWSLANGWKEGYTIDRIDNDGDYCPENCKWVSVSENSRKKSTTKIDMITAQEIRNRINEDWYDLAKEYNCTHGNIWFIMHNFTHVQEGECSKKLKQNKDFKQ